MFLNLGHFGRFLGVLFLMLVSKVKQVETLGVTTHHKSHSIFVNSRDRLAVNQDFNSFRQTLLVRLNDKGSGIVFSHVY